MSEPTFLKVFRPIGCTVVAKDHGDHLELTLLSVSRLKRKRGIATRALDSLKEVAAKRGIPIRLTLDRPRAKGLAIFYGKAGFVRGEGLAMEWRPAA